MGPWAADPVDEEVREQIGAAGLLQGDAERQDAAEEEDHLPVYGAVGLVDRRLPVRISRIAPTNAAAEMWSRPEAAATNHSGDDQNGGEPAAGLFVEGADIGDDDELAAPLESTELVLRRLDEQGVSGRQRGGGETAVADLVVVADGENRRPEAVTEIALVEALADEGRARRHHRFDDGGVIGLETEVAPTAAVADLDPVGRAQSPHAGQVGSNPQDVALLEDRVDFAAGSWSSP